jgi:glycolate oxidase
MSAPGAAPARHRATVPAGDRRDAELPGTFVDAVEELVGLLADGQVHTESGVLGRYRTDDAFTELEGMPLCAVAARSVADITATMRWATRHRIPVVPRGRYRAGGRRGRRRGLLGALPRRDDRH